jgi:hypothetical protein
MSYWSDKPWTVPAGTVMTPGLVNGLTAERQWAFNANRRSPTLGWPDYGMPTGKWKEWWGRMAMKRAAARPEAASGPTPAVWNAALDRAEQAYVHSFAWQATVQGDYNELLESGRFGEHACTCGHGQSKHVQRREDWPNYGKGRCKALNCECRGYVPGGFHPETIMDLAPEQRDGKPRTLTYMGGSIPGVKQDGWPVHYDCDSRVFRLSVYSRRTDLPKVELFPGRMDHPLEVQSLGKWTWKALMPILISRHNPESRLTTGTTPTTMKGTGKPPNVTGDPTKEVGMEWAKSGNRHIAETEIGTFAITGRKGRFTTRLGNDEVGGGKTLAQAKQVAEDTFALRQPQRQAPAPPKAATGSSEGWGKVRVRQVKDEREGASGLVYLPAECQGRNIEGRFTVRKNLDTQPWELVDESGTVTGYPSADAALAAVVAVVTSEPAPAPPEPEEEPAPEVEPETPAEPEADPAEVEEPEADPEVEAGDGEGGEPEPEAATVAA